MQSWRTAFRDGNKGTELWKQCHDNRVAAIACDHMDIDLSKHPDIDMSHLRTHVTLPQALVAEIDALVGKRKRSAFLSAVASKEVRRRRLLAALSRDTPAWDPADHPDIDEASGAAAWIRRLRTESDEASRRRIRSKRG